MRSDVEPGPADSGIFDVNAITAALPADTGQPVSAAIVHATADGSIRVLRVDQPAAAHYHATADEHAYVLQGSATFFAAHRQPQRLTPGQMFFVRRGTVHGISTIHDHPLVLLIIDTPRRSPGDMIFVDGAPA